MESLIPVKDSKPSPLLRAARTVWKCCRRSVGNITKCAAFASIAACLSSTAINADEIIMAPTGLTATNTATITVKWVYPFDLLVVDDPDFRVYWSDDLAIPMTNWVLVATTKAMAVKVTVVPGVNFFAVNASNFWGVSFFSDVTNTPPVVKTDVPLTITRP